MSNEKDQPLDDFLSSGFHKPPPNIKADHASKKEGKDYAARKNARADAMDNVRHWVLVSAIWAAFVLFAAVLVIRVLHLVLPDHCRWLTDADIQGVDKIIFSGAIGGAVGSYLDKAVRNKD